MYGFRKKEPPFVRAIRDLQLPDNKKEVLIERYSSLVNELQNKTYSITIVFHTARIMITVGSLIVPALLSIQYPSSGSINIVIYWSTWTISLLVTICNGLLALFKVDKQYYYLHTVREQLISDGWQYIELTGKYSGFYTPKLTPTHENQFIYFCHSVEKIRMRQIQEEYYKVSESSSAQHVGGAATGTAAAIEQGRTEVITTDKSALIPPSPLKGDLANIPEEVRKMILQLSGSMLEGVNDDLPKKEKGDAEKTHFKDGATGTVSV
jgi:hypothetical protein